ncbi:uncharacterized protein JCM10292_000975 [Rhodotorula paludigena]|uniref:uncharacterized protein n=1 Tax=Rhodotorula paludigena TaxID=86838 RepID=UPI0031737574
MLAPPVPPTQSHSIAAETTPAPKKARKKPRTLMCGHWHTRTWDLAHALNRNEKIECFAAVTDLRDALVVLRAAIPPADLILCSSYYPLEDVQEMLLDYEGEDIKILIAQPNHMNEKGVESVAEWAGHMVDSNSYLPRSGVLSPTGYMRRLSATSQNSEKSNQ